MLTHQIEKLHKEVEFSSLPVVVEGKKDRVVLKKLGFKNIIEISGRPLEKVVDEAKKFESVLILTDFDEEGKRIASRLSRLFVSQNIKNHLFLRKRFKTLFKVHKIEEIKSLTKLLEDDYYGKACSIYDKIFNRSRILMRRSGGKTRRDRSNIWSD